MSQPFVINGWKVYAHPCFTSQFKTLTEKVGQLREKYPEDFQRKKSTLVLAATVKTIMQRITRDPTSADFRQGNTLGPEYKHWFRAKFLQQFRLFFRYHEQHRIIILAWINDEQTLRAYHSKNDAYKVFKGMLDSGEPPDDWVSLLEASRGDSPFNEAFARVEQSL